jgi:FkbM family methyltransferase
MTSPRRVKQWIAPLVPEVVKSPLRARLFGYRPATVALPIEMNEEGAVLDERVRLRFGSADRHDFEYHLKDNGEAIEELAGFLAVSERAATLFDVGAARGLFSLLFCRLGGARRAVAFEPSGTLMDAGRRLALLNDVSGQVTWRQCVVGHRVGHASVAIDPAGFGAITAAPAADDPFVAMTTVDAEVDRLSVSPELIKIDVEGFEYEVLAGARRLLRTRKPALCIELHLDLLERRGVPPLDVLRQLDSLGYRYRTGAGVPVSSERIAGSMNALFRFIAT